MQLASERNIDQVLSEFREYASEVSDGFRAGQWMGDGWRGLGGEVGTPYLSAINLGSQWKIGKSPLSSEREQILEIHPFSSEP